MTDCKGQTREGVAFSGRTFGPPSGETSAITTRDLLLPQGLRGSQGGDVLE